MPSSEVGSVASTGQTSTVARSWLAASNVSTTHSMRMRPPTFVCRA